MKIKAKPRGRPFVKGCKTPNPRGRGAQYMPANKLTRIYTAEVIAKVYGALIDKTKKELEDIIASSEYAVLDQIIAKSMLRDLKNGEPENTERVLARVIGPITIKQEFAGAGGTPLVPPTIVFEATANKENSDAKT